MTASKQQIDVYTDMAFPCWRRWMGGLDCVPDTAMPCIASTNLSAQDDSGDVFEHVRRKRCNLP